MKYKPGDILVRVNNGRPIAWKKVQVFDTHIIVVDYEDGYGPAGRNNNFNINDYNDNDNWKLDEVCRVNRILSNYNE